MSEKVIAVYGLRAGDTERWKEELLAGSCKSDRDVEAVKTAASKDGFHSFRVSRFTLGGLPDFGAAVLRK
jgi:hypothetical protein